MPKSKRNRQHPWSAPVLQAEVPHSGCHFHLVADESTRAALAQLADIPALPRLEASFDITRHGGDGLRVLGRVSATVAQTCSVSLEPMTCEVNEQVDLVFLPTSAETALRASAQDVEVHLDDEPEVLIDGMIDLGALATEFLMLGINPYPRKPDSVLHALPAEELKSAGPFAALAGLGRQPGIVNETKRKKG